MTFFKSIKIKNIVAIEEGSFSFDQKLQVILGENKSGKSSIFYSILYAMGGLNALPISGEDFYRTGTKKSKVVLIFSVNSTLFSVERTRTKAILRQGSEIIALGNSTVTKEIKRLVGVESFRDFFITPERIIDLTSLYDVNKSLESMQGFITSQNYIKSIQSELTELEEKRANMSRFFVPCLAQLDKNKSEALSFDSLTSEKLKYEAAFDIKPPSFLNLKSLPDLKLELKQLKSSLNELSSATSAYVIWQKYENDRGYYESELVNIREKLIDLQPSYDERLKCNSQIKFKKLKNKINKIEPLLSSLDDNKLKLKKLSSVSIEKLNEAARDWENYGKYISVLDSLVTYPDKVKCEYDQVTFNLEQDYDGLKCRECGNPYDADKVEVLEYAINRRSEPALSPERNALVLKEYALVEDLKVDKPDSPFITNEDVVRKLNEMVLINGIIGNLEEKISDHSLLNDLIKKEKDYGIENPEDVLISCDKLIGQQERYQDRLSELNSLLLNLVHKDEATKPTGNESSYLLEISACECKIDMRIKYEDELETYNQKIADYDPKYFVDAYLNIEKINKQLLTLVRHPFELEQEAYLKAVSANKKYDDLTADILKCKDKLKSVKKYFVAAQSEVWSTLLSKANHFIGLMSDGSMSNIQIDNSRFTFDEETTEGLFKRNFRSGSGLQRTIIGFGLFLAENDLNGIEFPILLDEALGRLSVSNREKMIILLKRMPMQCLLIAQDAFQGDINTYTLK